MTLRQFVERGTVGTRAQREAFETGLLESHARAEETVGLFPGKSALDADLDAIIWRESFLFMYSALRLLRGGQ
jgi:hypothetical protein